MTHVRHVARSPRSQTIRISRAARCVALTTALCLLTASISFAASYDVTDLGSLGGPDAQAYAINGNGQIAGYSVTSAPASKNHAFLSFDGTMTDIDDLDSPESIAYGINTAGSIVGYAYFGAQPSKRGFIWSSTSGVLSLNPLSALHPEGEALDVNDSGVVVGWSYGDDNIPRAVRWPTGATGSPVNLGLLPGGNTSEAVAINNAGDIVGYGDGNGFERHAILWHANGTTEDLGTLAGGIMSAAYDINSNGHVAGFSDDQTGNWHPVIWTGNGIQKLGSLGGTDAIARAINDNGAVVGYARDSNGNPRAFAWSSLLGLIDLNDEIPQGTGWVLEDAYDVNNNGLIVGIGKVAGSPDVHAFLPMPRGADTTPPTLDRWDLTDDTGTSPTDRLTNDATPSIAFTFSQNVNGSASDITIADKDGLAVTPDGISGWGTSVVTALFTTPLTKDGLYSITLNGTTSIQDLTGNKLNGGRDEIVSFTLDTTAPTVTVNSLGTNDPTPPLSGTIDDDSATVTVRVNGKSYNATNNANGTWTLADNTISPALADGTYDLQVTATDPAGNVGQDSTTNELVIDTTPPAVTVNTLTTNDTSPPLSGTVDDTAATLSVRVAGKDYSATNNGDGTWVLADNSISPPLADGTYDVQAKATDAIGNVGTDTTTNELAIDTQPPTVTVNALTTDVTSPALSAVNDPGANVSVTVNGKTYAAVNDGLGAWSLAAGTISPPLAVGVYDVVVAATDAAGNVGTDSTTDELRITALPQITSTAVTQATEDVAYSYDVQSNVEGQPGVTYSLLQAPPQLSINSTTGVIQGTFVNCSAGDYAVRVQVRDSQGRTDTQDYTLHVANAPSQFINAPTSVSVLLGQTLTQDFQSDDEGVGPTAYSLKNAPSWLSVNAATGVVSGTPTDTSTLTNSPYTVTIEVNDGHATTDHTFTVTVKGQTIVLDPALRQTRARFIDGNGDKVFVRMSGRRGRITIYRAVDPTQPTGTTTYTTPSDIYAIELQNTDARTGLSINVRRDRKSTTADGVTPLPSLTGSASLGRLSGRNVDLTGKGIVLTGDGCISNIQLRDLVNGAGILMAGDKVTRGITIRVRNIRDATAMSIFSPIKRFSAARWGRGDLYCSRVSSFSITGDRRARINGDFGATLSAVEADRRGNSISRLTVKGSLLETAQISAGRGIGSANIGHWGAGATMAVGVIDDTSTLKNCRVRTYDKDYSGKKFGIAASHIKSIKLGRTRLKERDLPFRDTDFVVELVGGL